MLSQSAGNLWGETRFYTVGWDDLQAVIGVLEGGTLVTRLVKLRGKYTVGWDVGLAMGRAAVA